MVYGYAVYWIDFAEAWCPMAKFFQPDEMTVAMKFMEQLRKDQNNQFVTFSSQISTMIGKHGVDAVVDGKTPDGVAYTWVKRRIVREDNDV